MLQPNSSYTKCSYPGKPKYGEVGVFRSECTTCDICSKYSNNYTVNKPENKLLTHFRRTTLKNSYKSNRTLVHLLKEFRCLSFLVVCGIRHNIISGRNICFAQITHRLVFRRQFAEII